MGRDEEYRCATEYVRTRSPILAERLITANLRLVIVIAKSCRRAHVDLRDLIQEGNLGLMRAVERYDPERGIKLCSYAAWWIRAYILKYASTSWRAQSAAAPANDDTSSILSERRRPAGPKALEERLKAPSELRPDVRVESVNFAETLKGKLRIFRHALDDRDGVIFEQRLLCEEPATLTALSVTFGVSCERTRQLEKRLLGRLRQFLRQELRDDVASGELPA